MDELCGSPLKLRPPYVGAPSGSEARRDREGARPEARRLKSAERVNEGCSGPRSALGLDLLPYLTAHRAERSLRK
jgi:hypothetical protein